MPRSAYQPGRPKPSAAVVVYGKGANPSSSDPPPADPWSPDDDPEAAGRRPLVPLLLAVAALVVLVSGAVLTTGLLTDDEVDDRGAPDREITALPTGAPLPSSGPSGGGHGASSSAADAEEEGKGEKDEERGGEGAQRGARAAEDGSPAAQDGSVTEPITPGASASGGTDPSAPAEPPAPPAAGGTDTLRQGDTGAEVVELQKRLQQLLLYPILSEADGKYDAQVRDSVARYQEREDLHGDERGVYGPQTRRSLESQTREP